MDAELKQFLEGMERRAEERERELWSSLEQRMQQLHEYIDERTHDAETRIVRAFAAYQEASNVRMRKIEADVST